MASEAPNLSPCTGFASCSRYNGWPKFGGILSQPPGGLVITNTQLFVPLLPQPELVTAIVDPSPLIAAAMGRLMPSGSRVDMEIHVSALYLAKTVTNGTPRSVFTTTTVSPLLSRATRGGVLSTFCWYGSNRN